MVVYIEANLAAAGSAGECGRVRRCLHSALQRNPPAAATPASRRTTTALPDAQRLVARCRRTRWLR